jgi:hypothetical protein
MNRRIEIEKVLGWSGFSELRSPVRFYFAAKLRRLAKDRWGHNWKPIGYLTPRRFTSWLRKRN